MRRGAGWGILFVLAVASPSSAGEAAAFARGRTIEAKVSESGKVVPAPSTGTPPQRIAEGGAQSATCPPSQPLPATSAQALVEKIAREENFYPDFVLAVARAESRFQSDAASSRGAIGLMQLEPETAKHYGVDICDPADNVRGGVRFLRDLHKRYRNPLFILAAYNAGEKALAEHGGIPPFPETVKFVAEVVNDFYDWPAIAGKTSRSRIERSTANAASRASAREEGSKDERWQSGFVWNIE